MFTEPVTLTASRDGHHPETRTFPPPNTPVSRLVEGGSWHVQIYLAPLGPPADIAGVYTVTMSADSACSGLPPDTRSRTYTATVLPAGRSQFIATLSGARFHSIPCPPGRPPETCTHNRIGIGLAGDYASIGIGIIEELGESGFLTFQAGAAGTVGPTGISAPLGGEVFYCPTEPVLIDQGTWWCPVDTGVGCDSRHHQLTLTRR
jgi:hypothetical protein